jgi:hypothetical protein
MPSTERCHLVSEHRTVWAVPVVGRRITTLRHTRRSETINVGLEDRPIIVNKDISATIVCVSKSSHQERSHPAGDNLPGCHT